MWFWILTTSTHDKTRVRNQCSGVILYLGCRTVATVRVQLVRARWPWGFDRFCWCLCMHLPSLIRCPYNVVLSAVCDGLCCFFFLDCQRIADLKLLTVSEDCAWLGERFEFILKMACGLGMLCCAFALFQWRLEEYPEPLDAPFCRFMDKPAMVWLSRWLHVDWDWLPIHLSWSARTTSTQGVVKCRLSDLPRRFPRAI